MLTKASEVEGCSLAHEGRNRERREKVWSLVPSGLVKICAFLVCFVHHYKVKRKHYNSGL